jgi:hypothetical protein
MIPQKGAKQHKPDTATMHARVRHQNASASATRMTNGARRRRASRQRARCQGASWWREVWWNGLRSPARGRGEGQGGSDARRGGAERAWPTTERPSTAWPPNVRPTPATRQRGVVERLPPQVCAICHGGPRAAGPKYDRASNGRRPVGWPADAWPRRLSSTSRGESMHSPATGSGAPSATATTSYHFLNVHHRHTLGEAEPLESRADAVTGRRESPARYGAHPLFHLNAQRLLSPTDRQISVDICRYL